MVDKSHRLVGESVRLAAKCSCPDCKAVRLKIVEAEEQEQKVAGERNEAMQKCNEAMQKRLEERDKERNEATQKKLDEYQDQTPERNSNLLSTAVFGGIGLALAWSAFVVYTTAIVVQVLRWLGVLN